MSVTKRAMDMVAPLTRRSGWKCPGSARPRWRAAGRYCCPMSWRRGASLPISAYGRRTGSGLERTADLIPGPALGHPCDPHFRWNRHRSPSFRGSGAAFAHQTAAGKPGIVVNSMSRGANGQRSHPFRYTPCCPVQHLPLPSSGKKLLSGSRTFTALGASSRLLQETRVRFHISTYVISLHVPETTCQWRMNP